MSNLLDFAFIFMIIFDPEAKTYIKIYIIHDFFFMNFSHCNIGAFRERENLSQLFDFFGGSCKI